MSVTLGLVGRIIAKSGKYDSKIGGNPVWLNETFSPDVKCPNCSKEMVLITQLFTMPEGLDRALYVFGCNQAGCHENGFKVFRLQEKCEIATDSDHKENAEKKETCNAEWEASGDWGEDDDDDDDDDCWGDDDDGEEGEAIDIGTGDWGCSTDDYFAKLEGDVNKMCLEAEESKEEEKESVNDNNGGEKVGFDNSRWLTQYSIDLDDEPDEDVEDLDYRDFDNRLMEDDEGPKKGGSSNKESYEESSNAEKLLFKFQRKIALAPQQAIRYKLGGQPLWPCQASKLSVPKCSCGAKRQFEFQVMPTALYFLAPHKMQEKPEDAMDWGSIMVYTCSNNCEESTEEFVFGCAPVE